VKRRYGGALRNFEKAEEKLRLFPDRFLGVHVDQLRRAIEAARVETERKGEEKLAQFDADIIPRVMVKKQ
jgi:hypothetical protein